jgi:hypothetical protein
MVLLETMPRTQPRDADWFMQGGVVMKRCHRLFGCLIISVFIAGCAGAPVPDDNDDDETATNVTVDSGFTSAHREGSTTGQQEQAICAGWFPSTPNHTLLIDESSSLTVRASSAGDEKLWVVFGQSNYCGDGATAQEISRVWGTGTYQIYVGTTTQGAQLDYELDFTAN